MGTRSASQPNPAERPFAALMRPSGDTRHQSGGRPIPGASPIRPPARIGPDGVGYLGKVPPALIAGCPVQQPERGRREVRWIDDTPAVFLRAPRARQKEFADGRPVRLPGQNITRNGQHLILQRVFLPAAVTEQERERVVEVGVARRVPIDHRAVAPVPREKVIAELLFAHEILSRPFPNAVEGFPVIQQSGIEQRVCLTFAHRVVAVQRPHDAAVGRDEILLIIAPPFREIGLLPLRRDTGRGLRARARCEEGDTSDTGRKKGRR